MKLTEVLSGLQARYWYPQLTPITGGLCETVLLSHIVGWQGLGRDPDGWIYAECQSLMRELGMSRREFDSARRELKRRGFLEERYERLAHRMWFRINAEALNAAWEKHRQAAQEPERIPECAERTFPTVQNVHSGACKTYTRIESSCLSSGLASSPEDTTSILPYSQDTSSTEDYSTTILPFSQDSSTVHHDPDGCTEQKQIHAHKKRSRAPSGNKKPRTWDAAEPKKGTPYHVLWSAEQRARALLVTADLPIELRHIKTMLEHGFSEEQIVEFWLDTLEHRSQFALPRFLVSRIGLWAASRKNGGATNIGPHIGETLADVAERMGEVSRRIEEDDGWEEFRAYKW